MNAVRKGHTTITRVRGGSVTSRVISTEATTASPLFTLANLGSGIQVTRIRANGRDWYFANHNQFVVKIFDALVPTVTTDIPASVFTSVITAQTATTFTVTYDLPGTTTQVVLQGVLSLATGGILITASGAIDPVIYPTVGAWGVEIHVPVVPYEIATKSQMCAQIPAMGGISYRDATAVLAGPPTADYPGFHGSGHGIYPQTQSGTLASHQLACCWHLPSRSCLAIRAKNTDGSGSRFQYTGDGNNCIFIFTYFPPNHLQAQTFNFSTGIELRPMAGDQYDANAYYLGRIEAEAAPFVARGKRKDMSGAVGHISPLSLDADLMIVMAPGNAFPPTLIPNAAAWTRCATDITRIRADFGTDLKYICQWYSWQANGYDKYHDLYPPQAGFLTAAAAVANLSGVSQIVYIIPGAVDPDSLWAIANSTSTKIVLDPGNVARIITGFGQSAHNYSEFGNSSMRTHLRDLFALLTTNIPNLKGVYVDIISGFGCAGDYRLALADADKGVGAPFFNAGKKTWMDLLRTEFKTTQGITNWIQFGEWYDEHMLPMLDSLGGSVDFYPLSLDIVLDAFSTVYSQYVGNYDYGTAFLPLDAIDLLDYDIKMWRFERKFHQGALLGLSWQGFDFQLYIEAEAADGHADYATRFVTYQRPMLDFMKVLVRSLTTLGVRKYHRGRRLRPMPGAVEDRLMRNGYEIAAGPVFPGGIDGVLINGADVQASAWKSDEAGMGVGIILTNHHGDSRAFIITMGAEDYPDIGGGVRYLYENVAGVRTLVKSFFGAFIHTVTLSARSLRVFEVLTS